MVQKWRKLDNDGLDRRAAKLQGQQNVGGVVRLHPITGANLASFCRAFRGTVASN
jgi:hypothetical protein